MAKSFYIIDGHAHIYRSYFAPFRDLRSPSGEPTKATFVFTQMLLNLIDQRKPDYLAMVIDSGDETVFRKDIYPEYKANRTSPPDDFHPQEQRILQVVRDAGVPVYAKPGFEADDLIATMAEQLCGKGYDIFLVSKDKDLRQLLNDCTKMYDVQGDVFIDAASLEATVGYGPREAVEVQTLTGDTIDNVPGIPGVGEKTAARLVKKYGSADAVLQHLNDLTPKLRENFEKFGDRLPMARQLVTLKRDVEFDFHPEACAYTGLDTAALRTHLQELGFYSLLKRVGGDLPPAPSPLGPSVPKAKPAPSFTGGLFDMSPAPADEGSVAIAVAAPPLATSADCTYHLVDTEEKFQTLLADLRKQKRFAFDTETDDLGAMKSNLVGMSFSWEKSCGYYLPVLAPTGAVILDRASVLARLKPILENEKIGKVGHNIKYDLLVMRKAGIELRGVMLDSMVAAFLVDASRMQYGIDSLARDLFSFNKIPTADLIGKGKTQISMDRVALERIATYASEDADIALRLANFLEDKLDELPAIRKLNDDLETPLIDVLAEMEFNGISVNPAVLKEQSIAMGEKIDSLRKQVMEAACTEFNPDSPKQLADVLFNKLKLPAGKKTKTGYSTDVQVLERLSAVHPCPKLMLEYRSATKLKNTYLDNLPEYINAQTNRIHPSFSQVGAETGRLSCSDPNLQNIPIRTDEGRRIRLAFVPGDAERNVLMTADYSQIELRVLAHFTEEPALIRAFEADEDIHQTVAAEVFNVPIDQVSRQQRGYAKTINFGIIYGVSPWGLAARIEGLTVSSAEELIKTYNQRFPAIGKFFDQCVMEARTNGYVTTILGRRRRIPEINSGVVALRNGSERMAINSVVQGTAADLIKIAMLNVYRRLRREDRPSKLLLQVHDELVFETPKEAIESEAAMVREEMVNAMKLRVPLKVEVGTGANWQDAK